MYLKRKLSALLHALPVISLVVAAPHGYAQTSLYWGDTHLHTSHSTDAYASGNLLADPDVAYRYAKG